MVVDVVDVIDVLEGHLFLFAQVVGKKKNRTKFSPNVPTIPHILVGMTPTCHAHSFV